MGLTRKDAERFLVEVVKFVKWEELLKQDKLGFLRHLALHFRFHSYFQNITVLSTIPFQRQVPTEEVIIARGMAGYGGSCIIQNGFLALLLNALGLKAYNISGTFAIPSVKFPHVHVMTVVELAPDELFLLDAGVALALPEPVPLNQLPYTNKAGGFRYQFRLRNGEGPQKVYCRSQLGGSSTGVAFADPDEEKISFEFTLAPVSLASLQEPLHPIYTEVEESPLLYGPMLFRYFGEDPEGNLVDQVDLQGEKKWISIWFRTVIIGTDGDCKRQEYATFDEVKPTIFKYFPKIPKAEVEEALAYCHE